MADHVVGREHPIGVLHYRYTDADRSVYGAIKTHECKACSAPATGYVSWRKANLTVVWQYTCDDCAEGVVQIRALECLVS